MTGPPYDLTWWDDDHRIGRVTLDITGCLPVVWTWFKMIDQPGKQLVAVEGS